jgi:hypothetical protein
MAAPAAAWDTLILYYFQKCLTFSPQTQTKKSSKKKFNKLNKIFS